MQPTAILVTSQELKSAQMQTQGQRLVMPHVMETVELRQSSVQH